MDAAVEEIEAARGRDGSMTGIPTGFAGLDQLTNGLHPGQMIVLAARPAMGKSTLALDFARAAAIKSNAPCIFFSLEMGRSEIAMRLLSAEGQIPLQSMRKGTLDSRDWTTVASTRGRINDAPLYIDDSPNMTLVEIRAKCRRLKQREGLKMVVIDYLQLLTSGKRVESRQQEVSEFSRALKLMAKELQVPVIALSQLNRGAEQRADKKPALSDLRESGSIEQDADMVVLLHREAAYEKDSPRAGEADLIVAKHRNGPTDTITVAFQGTIRGSRIWRRGCDDLVGRAVSAPLGARPRARHSLSSRRSWRRPVEAQLAEGIAVGDRQRVKVMHEDLAGLVLSEYFVRVDEGTGCPREEVDRHGRFAVARSTMTDGVEPLCSVPLHASPLDSHGIGGPGRL